MPPMRKLIALLDPTLTVPVLTTVEAPLGPVTVQLTELICSPPGSVSCMPTVPVLPTEGSPVTGSGAPVPVAPGDEQPIGVQTMALAPMAPSSRTLRAVGERRIDLIEALRVRRCARARDQCRIAPGLCATSGPRKNLQN